MKFIRYLFPLLALFLTLAACGSGEKAPDASLPAPPTASSAPGASQAEPTISQPEPDASEPDNSEPPISLTEEEKAEAKETALSYYKNTVFEVHTLTELTPDQTPFWEGEIVFRATCSRDGEELPDRTIALERQDGVWTVINEGY